MAYDKEDIDNTNVDEDDDFEVEFYPDPSVFGNDNMRILHEEQFIKFVELRVHGIRSDVAFAQSFPNYAFGQEYRAAFERVAYLESTDWYTAEFDRRLKAKKSHEFWPVNVAINRLLQRIEDPSEKGSTRVAAIKELNVLCGITIVDEDGRTRSGSSLADFYAAFDAMKNGPSSPADVPGEPGKGFFD
jgi:hypothetical protein